MVMRYFPLMIAVVLVGCATLNDVAKQLWDSDLKEKKRVDKAEVKTTAEEERSEKPLITDPIVEKAIRKELEKPEGKLTEADLAKVTILHLSRTQITDVGLKEVAKLQNLEELQLAFTKITDTGFKELAKLRRLKYLWLDTSQITKAGVAELKKALPKCNIYHNATK